MYFSVIVPIYNRPDEIKEFLNSLSEMDFDKDFEVVVVEDGSSIPCEDVCKAFSDKLSISYFFKPNSGPGDSRNFGMRMAKGSYFLIFDSDCIIPKQYLSIIDRELQKAFVDCFGGPDGAHGSFTDVQKAINFAMTSFLTTGGVRGSGGDSRTFQPRSFNMGLSKEAFERSGGFGNIHPGEDPDLVLRLWKMGYRTKLIKDAYVYHKRRIDWDKFKLQVSKFGKARPILNKWHPDYVKPTFYLPSIFMIGAYLSILLVFFGQPLLLTLYLVYFISIAVVSSFKNKSINIGLLSVIAVWIQFYGYGNGFLLSVYKIHFKGMDPEKAFPELFFK